MGTRHTDPVVLHLAALVLAVVDEDGDELGLCELIPDESTPLVRETRFVHSPRCLGPCEYACGGAFITSAFNREDLTWSVVEVET